MALGFGKKRFPAGSTGPDRKGCRVIGVMGMGRGTGATHFTLWAANYLSAVRQRRTAVLEWNSHGDFQRLERICAGGQRREAPFFRVLDAAYYKRGCAATLASCMEGSYDEILIDFGQRTKAAQTEWLRCQVRIVTAAFSEWQLEDASGLMELGEELGRGWICLAAFGSEGARREAERKLKIPVIRMPFSADAFRVDRNAMAWFEQIL